MKSTNNTSNIEDPAYLQDVRTIRHAQTHTLKPVGIELTPVVKGSIAFGSSESTQLSS